MPWIVDPGRVQRRCPGWPRRSGARRACRCRVQSYPAALLPLPPSRPRQPVTVTLDGDPVRAQAGDLGVLLVARPRRARRPRRPARPGRADRDHAGRPAGRRRPRRPHGASSTGVRRAPRAAVGGGSPLGDLGGRRLRGDHRLARPSTWRPHRVVEPAPATRRSGDGSTRPRDLGAGSPHPERPGPPDVRRTPRLASRHAAEHPKADRSQVHLAVLGLLGGRAPQDPRLARRGDVPAGQGPGAKRAGSGREFFIIVDGTASVTRNGKKVATLGPGESLRRAGAARPPAPVGLGRVRDGHGRCSCSRSGSSTACSRRCPTIARKMLAAMAERLREADARAYD